MNQCSQDAGLLYTLTAAVGTFRRSEDILGPVAASQARLFFMRCKVCTWNLILQRAGAHVRDIAAAGTLRRSEYILGLLSPPGPTAFHEPQYVHAEVIAYRGETWATTLQQYARWAISAGPLFGGFGGMAVLRRCWR